MGCRKKSRPTRALLTGALLSLGTSITTTAVAQHRSSVVRPSIYTETKTPSSTIDHAAIAVGATGALVLSGGFIGLTYGPGLPPGCSPNDSLSGFCASKRDSEFRGPAIAMLTSGATAMAFSGGLLLANRGERPRHYVRNDAMLGAGIYLSGVAMSGIVGATAAWTYSLVDDDADSLAAGFSALMGVASGGILAIGAPLWSFGGRPVTYDPHAQRPADGEPTVRRSPTMMIGGIAFTTAGAAVIAAGIATASEHDLSLYSIVPNLLVGGPLLGLGLPMSVKGARNVKAQDAYAFVPRVQVGAGSLQVGWTF